MKKLLFPLLIICLLTGCENKKGYQIDGTVADSNLNGNYVYLLEYGVREFNPLDSALVENGRFSFKGTKSQPTLSVIRFDEFVVPPSRVPAGANSPYTAIFVLDNEKLNIKLDMVSTVNGTPENNDYSALLTSIAEKREALEPLLEDLRSPETEVYNAAERKYQDIENSIAQDIKNYILKNTDKQTAAKLFSDSRYSLNEEERREIVEKADETFVVVPGVPDIIEHLKVLDKVAVGTKFTDFQMNDVNGNTKRLSDYVGNGNVVLIDFWASWCPPCRKEMPHLVEIYKKYNRQGFEIVGVSLDSSKDAWEKGIKDLNITWSQLSDLQGWKNSGAALYGVNLIPHLVLIDKDGTIIAKNLNAEEVEKKLKEMFNKK